LKCVVSRNKQLKQSFLSNEYGVKVLTTPYMIANRKLMKQ